MAVGLSAIYRSESVLEHDGSGAGATLELGMNFNELTAVGLQVSAASLGGTYQAYLAAPVETVDLLPIDIGLYAQGVTHERYWGKLAAGVHEVRLNDQWYAGVGAGLSFGVDLVTVGQVRIAPFIGFEVIAGDLSTNSTLAGVSVRR